MEKIGRNQPCHCGSSKKYKKCCLKKDQEARPSVTLPPPPRDLALEEPWEDWEDDFEPDLEDEDLFDDSSEEVDDPEYQRWRAFWSAFRQGSLDEKLTMAREAIEGEAVLEGDLAFDLYAEVEEKLQQARRADEAEALLDLIETRHPDAYQEERSWFLLWRVENALLLDRDLSAPLNALVEAPIDALEPFFQVIDRLRYHGRVTGLTAALELLLLHPERLKDCMDSARLDLQEITLFLILDEMIGINPCLRHDDPALMERLAIFDGLKTEQLEPTLTHLTGNPERTWRPEELSFRGGTEELQKQLFMLLLEFSRELRVRWGWPASRAELARGNMHHVLSRNILDQAPVPRGRRGKKLSRRKAARRTPALTASSLLPTPEGVLRDIDLLTNSFYPMPHLVAAYCLAQDPWLQFLVDHGLANDDHADRLRKDLREERPHLIQPIRDQTSDPILIQDLDNDRDGIKASEGGTGR